jgi:transglutaminase-like putative cysteine protease
MTPIVAPVIEVTESDLQGAVSATYVLDQVVTYTYPEVVHDLRQQLLLVPRSRHDDQVRVADRLVVECADPTRSRRLTDRHGNAVIEVRAPRVAGRISFDVRAVVERGRLPGHPRLRSARTGTLARPGSPTALTAPDDDLHDTATDLRRRASAGDEVDLVEVIGAHVHASMHYAKGVTDVGTTAAVAWSRRAGVCQDMAHVMVALCRLNGIAARYVSGHLVGEGASHAWVEAAPERAGRRELVAFDPTHDRRTDLRYLTVAVGRDYADVAPTSGTYRSDVRGELGIAKTLTVTSVA